MSELPLHEIRLALVMNGGVSLAVWMAGVTHEIDLIRRATTPDTPAPRKHDEKVAEQWRELLQGEGAEDRRRLVVDVIAGTSAGGLNAAMLATAIAHDTTLDPEPPSPAPATPEATTPELNQLGADGRGASAGPWLREKWCSLGSLRHRRLIPDPEENAGPTGSVLDGTFFYEQAQQLLTELKAGKEQSSRHPVTLFTTASGLGVQEYTARDAAQQPFTVADHRFLYRFSNEPPCAYDAATQSFGPPTPPPEGDFADIDRLALAARASASFPVAFAPRRDEALHGTPSVRRRPRHETGKTSWLIDGGVLDNAPFGPVLAEVAAAPVSGPISRYVMYLVPSSGVTGPATHDDATPDTVPDWKDTIKAAVGYPREVDFRSDIEELEALRVEAETAWDDAQQAFTRATDNSEDRARLYQAARCLQPTYTRGRAAGGVWEALTFAQDGQLTRLDDSAAAPATDVEKILATHPLWTPPEGAPVCPFIGQDDPGENGSCAELPPDAVALWPWGLGPAERVVRTILRDLRANVAAAHRAGDVEVMDELTRHLTMLTEVRQDLRALRDAVGDALAAADPPIDPTNSPEEIAGRLNVEFARLHLQQALGGEIERLVTTLPDGAERVRTALALDVVSRCMSSRSPDQRSAPFKFIRLGPDVPLPMLTGADTETARQLGDRILYGTQVGHFGAFGAEEWRRWDWLMGRLHAVSHLGRLLHQGTPDEVDAWIKTTQELIVASENPDERYVTDTLAHLQQSFPPEQPLTGSLGKMLKAMNEADGARPVSTLQLGDRLVYASGGLPGGLGDVVKAAAGRTEPRPEAQQSRQDLSAERQRPRRRTGARLIRWTAEPTRRYLWTALTGSTDELEKSKGWPNVAFSYATWIVAAVVGLALLVTGARSGSGSTSWILAAVGAVVLTVALVGAVVALAFRRGRSFLATKTAQLLTNPPPPPSTSGGASSR